MIKRHASAIGHALDGLIWAVKNQPNYKIHIFLVILSVLGGVIFRVSYVEWIAIMITALMGIIIEAINTAVEKLGDAIDTNFNQNIKIAKDVSAGAMLLYATGAMIVAMVIFVPKIIILFF